MKPNECSNATHLYGLDFLFTVNKMILVKYVKLHPPNSSYL